MNDKIYTCIPVGKTAAVVTSQNGCTTELNKEQVRQNLIAKQKQLLSKITSLPKASKERKLLGKDYRCLCNEIGELRDHKKKCRDLANYILDVVREEKTSYQWKLLVDEAVRRKKKEEENLNNNINCGA